MLRVYVFLSVCAGWPTPEPYFSLSFPFCFSPAWCDAPPPVLMTSVFDCIQLTETPVTEAFAGGDDCCCFLSLNLLLHIVCGTLSCLLCCVYMLRPICVLPAGRLCVYIVSGSRGVTAIFVYRVRDCLTYVYVQRVRKVNDQISIQFLIGNLDLFNHSIFCLLCWPWSGMKFSPDIFSVPVCM